MNRAAEMSTRVDARAEATGAEPDSPRLTDITKQIAQDVRPLVGRLQPVLERADPLVARARRWADVLLPVVDEMRPLMDDLRPLMHDLRLLLGLLIARVGAAAARLDLGPVTGIGRLAATAVRSLASVRPTFSFAGPSLSVPTLQAPHVTAPSIGPRIAAIVGLTRRLLLGRWAFRAIAIGLIAFVVGNPSLRDAMVDEVNWTRSVLQTIEVPTLEIPAIELPTIVLPTVELPPIELPTFQIPTFEIPNFQFPKQDAAASPKLAPAPFELPPLTAYRAAFESQASYPTVSPNATVEWVVALRNTGSAGWYRGIAGAQASLALADGTEAAVQTTAYVAPGQVGWFIVHFRAPAESGRHSIALLPRIDGRGELPNLGIYALVTVR